MPKVAGDDDEKHMFERRDYSDIKKGKQRQGIRTTQKVIKFVTYTASAIFIGFYCIGIAYVCHTYGDGFTSKLEEMNRSKRVSFWRRRNDEVDFQTRKQTDAWTFFGFNPFAVSADDDLPKSL